mgnify:CR=1 FL=1
MEQFFASYLLNSLPCDVIQWNLFENNDNNTIVNFICMSFFSNAHAQHVTKIKNCYYPKKSGTVDGKYYFRIL